MVCNKFCWDAATTSAAAFHCIVAAVASNFHCMSNNLFSLEALCVCVQWEWELGESECAICQKGWLNAQNGNALCRGF